MTDNKKPASAGTGTGSKTASSAQNSTSNDRHYPTPEEIKALSASLPSLLWIPHPNSVANHIALQAWGAAYAQARVLDAVERYRVAYPEADLLTLATLAHTEMLARQDFRCGGAA